MSMLQVVARRAIRHHHCLNNNESLLVPLIRSTCSQRRSLSTLSSKCQEVPLHDGNAVSCSNYKYSIGSRHPFAKSYPNNNATPPSLSSIRIRYYSAPAPQKETTTAHISSSINNDDLSTTNTIDNVPTKDPIGARVEETEKSSINNNNALSQSQEIKQTKQQQQIITEKKGDGNNNIIKKAQETILWAIQSIISLMAKTPGVLWFYITNPKEFRNKLVELKDMAVKEAHHYWMGSKLLAADVRTARHILGRVLRGSTLSRRERKQLLRTVTDVFRLVPMSIFVLVPFMEFALPFALKIFPNMLPSTFQDSLKEEEKMKGELQMRISMAGFFQDTLAELAKEQKKSATLRKANTDEASDAESIEMEKEDSAKTFLEFLQKARSGERIPPKAIIKFAGYFSDNLTLDNMERMQLIPMCKYMGILPYGNDNLLRFQLRHKIRVLKDDDQRILWEGIESLTKMELREACRERGMRSTGLSKEAYRKSMEEWLELSVKQNVPISLLIMSRTFYLHDEMVTGESQPDDGSKNVAGLADAMSGIDKDVLNEIVLEMATPKEKSSNTDVMKIQLEVLEHHNELIKEEQEERDAAAKEKAEEERKRIEEKEAAEKEKTEEATSEPVEKQLDGANSTDEFVRANVEPEILTAEETKTAEEEEDEQVELSAEEIEAISTLVSPDPLCREREDLQRIKDKFEADDSDGSQGVTIDNDKDESNKESLEMMSAISPDEPMYTDEAQKDAVQSIRDLDEINEIRREAKSVVSLRGDTGAKIVVENPDIDVGAGDQKLQKAIDRLKGRIESMVGKIETHLSDVEVKIGNKFHLLDKDMVSCIFVPLVPLSQYVHVFTNVDPV